MRDIIGVSVSRYPTQSDNVAQQKDGNGTWAECNRNKTGLCQIRINDALEKKAVRSEVAEGAQRHLLAAARPEDAGAPSGGDVGGLIWNIRGGMGTGSPGRLRKAVLISGWPMRVVASMAQSGNRGEVEAAMESRLRRGPLSGLNFLLNP
ncbi:hypothetical protein S7711_10526 [Stachybotrys chartarum IBT 7711]|uniref:Uncharacterized protein n=1 Tax=Stachybotrys chartarum (strain CBS 109288 / IBT 7711) TaxID=1280523 RepID=A0A084AMX1_STACB|nr:hypothetical protein S7711_10526 [Stachybotrys chartarum IBT 7711]KFA48882.1 hypothetical protein S40293_10525 [Stachybotrys chartarum IBT 40293]